jgi:hypothetical protein
MVRPGNQTREVVDTTIIVIISSLRIMTDSALKDRKQEEARAKLRPAGAPRKCDRTRLLYDLCFKNALKRKKELVKSFSVLYLLARYVLSVQMPRLLLLVVCSSSRRDLTQLLQQHTTRPSSPKPNTTRQRG